MGALVQTSVHIRCMLLRDMPTVLRIEEESFEFPWTEEEFLRTLRQRNCIGLVAEVDEQVVGFVIYEVHRNRQHLLSIAVAAESRKARVGAAMVSKLKSKLTLERRNRIMLEVRETNLDAQLFFQAMGFRAISVLRDFYDDDRTHEDAYLMQYRLNQQASE